MSSQVLTMTGPGGLPRSPPPGPDLSHSAHSVWTDHMNADEGTATAVTLLQDLDTQEQTFSSSQSNQETTHQKIGNLIQLLGRAQTATVPPAVQTSDLMVYPEETSALPVFSMDLQEQHTPSDNENMHAPANGTDVANDPFALSTSVELPPFPPNSYASHQTMALKMHDLPQADSAQLDAPTQDRREVEAFAKIEFQDGNYYITTWQCELGRDAFAYKAALDRAEEVKNNPAAAQSSSGRLSRPSDRVRRHDDSQMQGSVLSEAGGFGGIDEAVPAGDSKPDANGHPSHSSQLSSSDVVRPQEVHYHPPTVPFDYHRHVEMHAKAVEPDWEQPAPVTAEHMPDADQCPIIPIHAMTNSVSDELQTHKNISRRHVRIEWDFDAECFKLKVLGRNGAFVNNVWKGKGTSTRLLSGSTIQVSGISMTFRLPRPKTASPSEISGDEAEDGLDDRGSTSPISYEALETSGGQHKTKISVHSSAAPASREPMLGPDGQPIIRKRGPGRPPKDGIMSTRQRRELEKAQKLAEAKAANGGKTPPPMAMARGKPTRPPTNEEVAKVEVKPEKRKYNKRKREGEDGDILPSIEPGEEDLDSNDDKPPNKKPRASKSPSPEYPSYASLTEEQLQRPNEPYAKVIYDLLLEIYPKTQPLKGVYRMIKTRYPFFVYRVESDGWQSSVRHNLNQEYGKLFDKGEKEGKGYAWRAIPGAIHPQQERKRAAPTAPPSKPKPQAPRNPSQMQPQHPQQPPQWPNNQGYPSQHWPQGQQGPYPLPPNGLPYPGSTLYPPTAHQMLPGPNGVPLQQGQLNSQISTPQSSNSYPLPPPHQPSSGTPQQAPLAPSSSVPSASNMPCTLDGLIAIRRFEECMYDQVRKGSNPQSLEYWQQVFASAKKRLLHGHTGSSMPSGETQEELVIMGHLGAIRERFRNGRFTGFGERRDTPPVTTAGLLPVVGANDIESTANRPEQEGGGEVTPAADVDSGSVNEQEERMKSASPAPSSGSVLANGVDEAATASPNNGGTGEKSEELE